MTTCYKRGKRQGKVHVFLDSSYICVCGERDRRKKMMR